MNDRLLYYKKRAAAESFEEALRALIAAGYEVISAPTQNRDGRSARLKKEEEISLEWSDTDVLTVSSLAIPSERLKSEASLILRAARLREVKII